MKGGYQIIDLSTALVGSDSVIKGIYQTIKHFDGKPVFIITPHNSGVFAEFMENNGTYIGSYIDSNSHLFTVSITSTNHVTIADNDVIGAITELNSKIYEAVTVTGGVTETFGDLLNRLCGLLDFTRITEKSSITIDAHVVRPAFSYGSGIYQFSGFYTSSGTIYLYGLMLKANNSAYWRTFIDGTTTEYTAQSASGKIIQFVY